MGYFPADLWGIAPIDKGILITKLNFFLADAKKTVNLHWKSNSTIFMTIDTIKKQLRQALPGASSHLKMAPAHRLDEFRAIRGEDFNPRLSAVLVLLYPGEQASEPESSFSLSLDEVSPSSGTAHLAGLKIVFIRRGEYVGIHSGQIAFPGGRYEDEDGDLCETAMREAEEEIGLPRHSYEIIGQLTDLYVPPSNFLVRAFVAYAPQRPVYTPDPREVQEVIEVDLSHFFNSANIKVKDFPAHNSVTNTSAPYYDADGVVIWGATAMMLRELVDLIGK
jgi:8-oxo-dGTP pyrophosphatase MutT (NUDIX family)